VNIVPGAALVFEGELSWQLLPLAALPTATKLAATSDSNELLLHNILLSDEKRDKYEHDENDVLLFELKKQDLKLRLVLELLGTLLVKNDLIPLVKPVRFSSTEIGVPAKYVNGYHERSSQEESAQEESAQEESAQEESAQKDAWFEFSLYLDTALPRPLVLYANAESATDDGWLGFQIHPLRQSVQDNLEKFIFRYHRKVVAQSRKANSVKEP
jgi:hypothetical protein